MKQSEIVEKAQGALHRKTDMYSCDLFAVRMFDGKYYVIKNKYGISITATVNDRTGYFSSDDFIKILSSEKIKYPIILNENCL